MRLTVKDAPAILPFVRPAPEPILRTWKTFVIGGIPYRVIGERWHTRDVPRLDVSCQIDPGRPGEALSFRMIDLSTGQAIAPASDEDLASLLGGPRSPQRGA